MFDETSVAASRILEDSEPYSRDSFMVLKILILIAMFLSLFSALYIIMIYICYSKTRNFAFKMVFYLNIADFLYSISQLFILKNPEFLFDVEFSDTLCLAQSFMMTWFGLSSILWTSIIAWTLYSTVILNNTNIEEKEIKYLFMGFILPLMASILPFITKDYGSNGLYCWFNTKEGNIKTTVLEIAYLYLELWIALFFNAIVFYKVISVLKVVVVSSDGSWIRKLRFYPLILLICWTWGTVHKIYSLANPLSKDVNVVWLVFLHVFFCSLQGTFNALIYGLNSGVMKIIKGQLCCCCLKEESQTENMIKHQDGNGVVEMDSMAKHARESLSSTWSYDPRESVPDLPEMRKNTFMMKEITEYVLG